MGSSAGITQKHCSLENKSLSIVLIHFCFLLLPSGDHGNFLWVPFTQSQKQLLTSQDQVFFLSAGGSYLLEQLSSRLVCVSCVPAGGLSCDPQSCQVPPPPLLFQWYHRVPLLLWADSKSRHASSWPSTLWPEFSAVSREAVVGDCRVVWHPLFAEPSERAGGSLCAEDPPCSPSLPHPMSLPCPVSWGSPVENCLWAFGTPELCLCSCFVYIHFQKWNSRTSFITSKYLIPALFFLEWEHPGLCLVSFVCEGPFPQHH